MKKIKKTILSVLILVGGLLFFYWLIFSSPFDSRKFDRSVWMIVSYENESQCVRGPMANDVKENIVKVGTTRSELINLLGPPNKEFGNEYWYVLGMCRGVDYDILHVHFDENGKVVSVEIRSS